MFFAKQSTLSLLVMYGFMALATLSSFLQAKSGFATSEVCGKAIGNRGYARWKWMLQFPAGINPVVADGNADCDLGQKGKVWFLAGRFSSTAVELAQSKHNSN
ncbi:MAG: hypothetical protein ABL933_00750 [Methyloglobulus sp.]|nr:hypothetical protein [Methyloglobulus sp.]